MKRDINSHGGALEHLVNHLNIIGIDRKKVAWIVKEPIIFKEGTMFNERACDIVVGYNKPYRHVDLIELKHSKSMNYKAREQIKNTQLNLTDNWVYPTQNKYIVYYPTFDYTILEDTDEGLELSNGCPDYDY